MEVGMSSLGSFSELFARRVGARPSAFQKHARDANLSPGCFSLMGGVPADAFRNLEEAKEVDVPLECGMSDEGEFHANQAHQHHGE